MPDRRYNDDEVSAIFRVAAEGSETRTPAGDHANGLTLRDLQAIGREVDISPDAVSYAAQSLDRPSEPPVSQTFLGLPIAVERSVSLNRRLTDAEWELLVVELRDVFHARGTVHADGSLREWSNGNLHALLEPTATGHRLRLGTSKGNARVSFVVGMLNLGMAVALLVQSHGTLPRAALGVAALATIGTALVAKSTLGLPGWARRRRRQMDGIVDRLTAATQDGHRSEQALSSG